MNNKDYIYISIILIVLILIIYCFINLNKKKNINYEEQEEIKYNYKIIEKNEDDKINYNEMPPANNDIFNNEKGYINELIKNVNNKEGIYSEIYKNKIDILNDNDIGFCTKSKEQKKELPYANINVCYLEK